MKTLVEDLLLLARLDQTRPVERAPVDLAVLAAEHGGEATAANAVGGGAIFTVRLPLDNPPG